MIAALVAPASAQEEPGEAAPAHVSVVDGVASLERGGRVDPAPVNVPLLAGDRVRTEAGRVEVLFGDGSVLYLDHFTTIDLLSDSLLRLLQGRLRLVVNAGAPVQYRIDAPSGSVRIPEAGEYRVSILSPARDRLDVELVVLRGSAEIANELGSTLVGPGARSIALDRAAPTYAQPYNVAYWDAFERWVEDRRAARLGVASSQYLPPEVQSYGGSFDRHGYWRHDVSFGYVWYPRVHVGWRPYHYGRWDYIGPYGWTWVGYDPWAWPTHHFGRWGFSAGAWFWMPARRWGPAWVHWAAAPGYVAWCPLGFDGRPVVGINVNLYHQAWTVIPRQSFAPNVAVPRHAVTTLPAATGFITQSAAPLPLRRGDRAIPRGAIPPDRAEPIRSAGRRSDVAVPRGAVTPAPLAVPAESTAPSAFPREPSRVVRGAEAPGERPIRAPARARDLGAGGPLLPSAAPGSDRDVARPRGDAPSRGLEPPAGAMYRAPRPGDLPDSWQSDRLPRAQSSAIPSRRAPEPTGSDSRATGSHPRVSPRGSDPVSAPPVYAPRGYGGGAPDRAVPRGAPPDRGEPRPEPRGERSGGGVRAVPRGAPSAPPGPPPAAGPPPSRGGHSRGEPPSRGGGGGAAVPRRPPR